MQGHSLFYLLENYMAFKRVKKKDSFAQWFIDNFGVDKFNELVLHQKNIDNGIDIWHISPQSSAQLWFKCENKEYHEYCITAEKYHKGCRCKYCARTKYVHPLDSFGQYIIDNYNRDFLERIWSSKNKKSPFKYTTGTEQKAHFNCYQCGNYIGESQIKNYIRGHKLCGKCKNSLSSLHQKVIDYLKKMNYEINTEHNCSIIPINPVTKLPLPFDVEVKKHKLIIEIHGKQHYELIGENSKWLHGLSSAEYLAKRKKYDEFKKSFALSNGYFYLEIPYWSEKDDQYKILINEKIKEIDTHIIRATTDTKMGYHG